MSITDRPVSTTLDTSWAATGGGSPSAAPASTLAAEVLGSLRLHRDGADVTPSAGKLRQVTALLLLQEGRTVPLEQLAEELWGDDLPRSATTTVQTYVLSLRQLLAGALGVGSAVIADEVLQTHGRGYRLCTPWFESDLRRFRALHARGRDADAHGDTTAAAELFAQAESLWRGPVLSDVAHGAHVEAEVAALERAWFTMVERRIEIDLSRGGHREVQSDLARLTSRYPLHERIQGLFMLALYRSGDRAGAVDAFQRTRRVLAEELGLDPSPQLTSLMSGIITSDARLLEHSVYPV